MLSCYTKFKLFRGRGGKLEVKDWGHHRDKKKEKLCSFSQGSMHKEKGVLSSGFFLEEVGGITRGGIKYQIWIFWDFGEERWNWQNDFGFSNDLLGIFLTYSFLCEKLNLRFLYFAKFPILPMLCTTFLLILTYLLPLTT